MIHEVALAIVASSPVVVYRTVVSAVVAPRRGTGLIGPVELGIAICCINNTTNASNQNCCFL